MNIKKICKTIIAALTAVLASCNTAYYSPNMQHVPMLDSEGDAEVIGSITGSPFGASHFGIMVLLPNTNTKSSEAHVVTTNEDSINLNTYLLKQYAFCDCVFESTQKLDSTYTDWPQGYLFNNLGYPPELYEDLSVVVDKMVDDVDNYTDVEGHQFINIHCITFYESQFLDSVVTDLHNKYGGIENLDYSKYKRDMEKIIQEIHKNDKIDKD